MSLYPHERLVVILFVGSILSLSLYGYLSKAPEIKLGQEIWLKSPYVSIGVEGAVKRPGTYKVLKNKMVKDAIEMAEPEEFADLKRKDMDVKLLRAKKIIVKPKKST